MTYREIEPAAPSTATGVPGRKLFASIGIDAYRHWRPLRNAVSDAGGAWELFRDLGFAEAAPALLDERATGGALRALVDDDLATLGENDSLVVFYAGHGGSQTHQRDGKTIKTGYLVPCDADREKVSTWIDLESWLRKVALLPPRHILVILDACYSGIALDPVVTWRDEPRPMPFEALQARTSRRIITSALDNERALDSGPVRGHSLFTGCLIGALRGGMTAVDGATTGSELGAWLRRRVQSYPRARQTPDFGTFDFHDHGEMIIPVLQARPLEPTSRALRPGLDDDLRPPQGNPPTAVVVAPPPPVPERFPAWPAASSRPQPRESAPASMHAPRARRPRRLLRVLRSEASWLLIIVPLAILALLGALLAAR